MLDTEHVAAMTDCDRRVGPPQIRLRDWCLPRRLYWQPVYSPGSHSDAGQTSKTITVAVQGDKKKDAREAFFINLGAATNAIVEVAQAIGEIINND